MPQYAFRVAGHGADAGADGGRAHVHFLQKFLCFLQAQNVLAQGRRKGRKLLPKRHRHGVLQLRPAHFDHIGKFPALRRESIRQIAHRRKETPQRHPETEAEGGGINVIRALAEVDVLVRVNEGVVAALFSRQFQRPVGDHFVGVHVGRGARPALHHVHYEMRVMLPGDQLVTRGGDKSAFFLRQQTKVAVGQCAGFFHPSQSANQAGIIAQGNAGDGKILHAAQRLDAVQRLRRHLPLAQQILFRAKFLRSFLRPRRPVRDLLQQAALKTSPPGRIFLRQPVQRLPRPYPGRHRLQHLGGQRMRPGRVQQDFLAQHRSFAQIRHHVGHIVDALSQAHHTRRQNEQPRPGHFFMKKHFTRSVIRQFSLGANFRHFLCRNVLQNRGQNSFMHIFHHATLSPASRKLKSLCARRNFLRA